MCGHGSIIRQTIGREERYHGSLKLEHLYRVLPSNRTELSKRSKSIGSFTLREAPHEPGYRTPAAVYLTRTARNLTIRPYLCSKSVGQDRMLSGTSSLAQLSRRTM